MQSGAAVDRAPTAAGGKPVVTVPVAVPLPRDGASSKSVTVTTSVVS